MKDFIVILVIVVFGSMILFSCSPNTETITKESTTTTTRAILISETGDTIQVWYNIEDYYHIDDIICFNVNGRCTRISGGILIIEEYYGEYSN